LLAATASDKSINASVGSTKVQFHGHSVANYTTANVTQVPANFLTVDSQIT
jgi:hypothetical protein